MSTQNPNTQSAILTLCTKRIAALQADVPQGTVIEVAGKSYTVAQAVAVYQAAAAGHAATDTQRSLFKQSIAARDATDATCRAFDLGLKAWAATKFAAGTPAANDFGVGRKAAVPKTAAEKAEAAAKAKATRKARNTLGPKAKLTVKGTPPASTTPSTSATVPNLEAKMPASIVTNGAAHS